MRSDVQPTITGLMDDLKAAQYLGISVFTLRADRCGNRRVPFVRIGRTIRYSAAALDALIEQNTVGGNVERVA